MDRTVEGAHMNFSVVSGKAVHEHLFANLDQCVDVVARAYVAHHQGKTVNPNSYFLRFPDDPSNRIIALPASIGDGIDVSGVKWIASYPGNIANGIPRASAVLILNDAETGYPFACLEASIISAARTAASAALAARQLLPGARCALGIVGTGLIARYVYTFLMGTGWSVDKLALFDTNATEAERFKARSIDASRHREVVVCQDVESLLRASDLVCLTTTASKPYIDDLSLLTHRPVVLNLSLRDIAPELILESENIVDDVGHVMNADTSPHLAEKLVGHRDFVSGTIPQLVLGECRPDRSRAVIVSPFGLGVLDLAVGRWIYDMATSRGTTVHIDDFFFEMAR
jgi:N-[(2S)-2-amino-2-carboxyethyl]-L-glutamate dehydrogenase